MSTALSWYKQDGFWETVQPVMFHEKSLAEAPAEVEQLLRLLDIEPGDRILDLCCGIGRHSIEFSKLGFDVTGVDRTRFYLDQARRKAAEQNLSARWVEKDIRKFSQPQTFDIVINMFSSFGYFEHDEDDKKVLENVHRSLKPGGRFLIDLLGKEILAREFRPHDWREHGGTLVLEERTLNNDWSRIHSRWIVIRDNQQFEYELNLRLYSAAELSRLFADSGFTGIEVYGDFVGSPYDRKARRLVVVGRKP